VDRVKSMLPMQRGGQPEEVAQAIVWLLSDKASYVTGSFLDWRAGDNRQFVSRGRLRPYPGTKSHLTPSVARQRSASRERR
jgi:hypothetical protein